MFGGEEHSIVCTAPKSNEPNTDEGGNEEQVTKKQGKQNENFMLLHAQKVSNVQSSLTIQINSMFQSHYKLQIRFGRIKTLLHLHAFFIWRRFVNVI